MRSSGDSTTSRQSHQCIKAARTNPRELTSAHSGAPCCYCIKGRSVDMVRKVRIADMLDGIDCHPCMIA